MQSDLEEAGELRLRKQVAPPPPSAAAATNSKKEEKKKKSKTPSWLANARRVNVWSVKVKERKKPFFFSIAKGRQLSLLLSCSLFGPEPDLTKKEKKNEYKNRPGPRSGPPSAPAGASSTASYFISTRPSICYAASGRRCCSTCASSRSSLPPTCSRR